MKRIAVFLLCAAACLALAGRARAAFDPGVDYMALMQEAAVRGDRAAGLEAEARRNEKIDRLGLGYEKVGWDELYILAKVICAEGGGSGSTDEWKLCVGEVVLNRVASPEFPDTIWDVCMQPGRYGWVLTAQYDALYPDRHSAELALRLLEGERVLADPAVVFQSERVQGSGICRALYDDRLGWTYFCYSFYPELYPDAGR